MHVTRLRAEELLVVCSPELLPGGTRVREPADLAKHTLLHVNDRHDWSRWLEAADVETVEFYAWPTQPGQHGHRCRGRWPGRCTCAECARDLGPHRWPLVRPFDGVARSLCLLDRLPKANGNLPKIVMFRDWLLAEVAEELRHGVAPEPAHGTMTDAHAAPDGVWLFCFSSVLASASNRCAI